LTRPNSTVCFLEEFQAWHQQNYEGNSTYGLTQAVFNDRLILFRETTQPKDGGTTASSWKELIGVVNGQLRFFRLDARLSLDLEDSIIKKGQVLRRTNSFVSNYARDLDTELPDVWQTSDAWIWYKAQAELVEGLLSGMAIAFPIALVVLTGATGNIVLALFAIYTIGNIVSCVLGLAYLLGWYLGVKEAVAGVVVIGLAVDYTLHLGHMYDHDNSKPKTREEKVVQAVVTMGPTVFFGAVTTAGSAIFLLLAQLTFFTQMAILIIATVLASIIYSLFFFVPLLYILGPEGDFGSLRQIRRLCSSCCCNNNNNKETSLSNTRAEPTDDEL